MPANLKCGDNLLPGSTIYGFGFGDTKAKARRAAVDMANAIVFPVSKAQLDDYKCPKTEEEPCPVKAVAGRIKEVTTEISHIRLAPQLHYFILTKSYELLVKCRKS
jgi:hypothetical protein